MDVGMVITYLQIMTRDMHTCRWHVTCMCRWHVACMWMACDVHVDSGL